MNGSDAHEANRVHIDGIQSVFYIQRKVLKLNEIVCA